MLKEVFLAAVQAATEFLPISSSGHLAIFSNLISEPNVFFFTTLHLASLLAVLIFTREEIIALFTFKKEYRKVWIYLIVATIPANICGFIFSANIEKAFSSLLVVGIAFLFTSAVLYLTKFAKETKDLSIKNSILIGIFQSIALLPGVSRSGMTISSALLSGIGKEKATKFSFLLFIPLSIEAFLFEAKEGFYFNFSLFISLIVCFVLSLLFLNLLFNIVKKGKMWVFSIYCLFAGITSILLHFF